MSPKIRQFTIYYAGLLGRWDKRIVNQASDVPSIIFFHDFLQNSLQKFFQFIVIFFICNYTKIKIKSFECPKSKPATHCFIFNGRWDERLSDPSYYIEDCWISKDCRIFKFKSWMDSNAHKSQDADVRSSDMKRFLSMCTWPTNAMAQKWNIFIESIYRRKCIPSI